jgi:hypothetical protein
LLIVGRVAPDAIIDSRTALSFSGPNPAASLVPDLRMSGLSAARIQATSEVTGLGSSPFAISAG